MQNSLYDFSYDDEYDEDNDKVICTKWKILDFNSLLAKNIKTIRTNKNIDYEIDSVPTNLMFEFKIEIMGKENDFVEIYYLAPVPVFMRFDFSIRHNGTSNILNTKPRWIQGNYWHLIKVMLKSTLVANYTVYNRDGSRSLALEFKFFVNNNSYPINEENEYENMPKSNLVNDLETLLKNTSLSDVIIKSADGIEFPAHKNILITRCAVLKAHFEHNTKEILTSTVDCPLQSEVLQEMLHYIYTDSAPKINQMPEKMLVAADFYQLDGLKILSEKALVKQLSVENAIETLELADLHSANNLKRNTLKFINNGHAKEIFETKGWENIQSVALIKSIFEFNYK